MRVLYKYAFRASGVWYETAKFYESDSEAQRDRPSLAQKVIRLDYTKIEVSE